MLRAKCQCASNLAIFPKFFKKNCNFRAAGASSDSDTIETAQYNGDGKRRDSVDPRLLATLLKPSHHADLVTRAMAFLDYQPNPAEWLDKYDEVLAEPNDFALEDFCAMAEALPH
jgi:hypothetical protein